MTSVYKAGDGSKEDWKFEGGSEIVMGNWWCVVLVLGVLLQPRVAVSEIIIPRSRLFPSPACVAGFGGGSLLECPGKNVDVKVLEALRTAFETVPMR